MIKIGEFKSVRKAKDFIRKYLAEKLAVEEIEITVTSENRLPGWVLFRPSFGPPIETAAKGGAPTPFVNAFDTLAVGSLRYNTSMAGQPLQIVWGTQRVGVNILEFWGYQGSSAKGGKGSSSGSSGKGASKKQANYSVYVAMAICQGPISLTGSIHGSGGENEIFSNAGIAYGVSAVGLNFYSGTDGQSPDPTFVSSDTNSPVVGYSGTGYVTGDPLQLGQSPSLPNISFEVTGFEVNETFNNFPNDCIPSDIIVDMLTNARYGAYFPPANLDSGGTIADLGSYCIANSLAMSLLMDHCQPAARWVEEICQLTVAAPFWSGALLKIIPYSTTIASGNGTTWTPNLTPLYTVTDSDYIDWGGDSDPVIVTRSDPTQATNWFGQEYYDGYNYYNPNISYAFDQGAIDEYGLRNEPVGEAHSFTNSTSAQASAQLQLNRKQLIRNTFKFQLGWNYCLLDPMDIIEITDVNIGLNASPVRITGISENDNGELSFDAEELPGVNSTQPLYNTTTPGSAIPNFNITPPSVNTPVIFEPNPSLTGGLNEVWIIATGMPPDWGGAAIYVSISSSAYQYIGTVYTGAPQGVLTAPLVAYGGGNPDTANTLAVNLSESGGQLQTVSSGAASAAATLCYVEGELLSYETATLTSAENYNLTTLYRGLYGTTAGSHGTSSLFAYVGITNEPVGLLKYVYSPSLIGQTIDFKLVSFNQFLGETQSLASVSPYTYTLNGSGSVSPVNVPFSFAGIPQNAVPILNYTFGVGDNFPANFTSSICTSGVAAASNTIFNISKNGTNFATMTFGASMGFGTFSGSAETFASGDVLTITPTRTDATLANLTGNLAGMS